MKIGNHRIGPDEDTFVIAEAGSNHNGDLETAKELIDVATEAGVDAVKFQVFEADSLYVEDSGTDESLDENQSIHDIISTLELPREWIPELKSHCERRDIVFLSTPFDERAIDVLDEYVPAYKIASSSITHLPFLECVAKTGKPILMSTGAHELPEIEAGIRTLREAGVSDLALFHCVSSYPTPIDQINVKAIDTLRESFSLPVGLSDHTMDPIIAPCAAVSRGATVVEKHFTLDREMEGPDHPFALEPDELADMVTAVRQTESALGDGEVGVQDIESHTYEVARRSIHATRDIIAGEQLTEENIAVLRSGMRDKGAPPSVYDDLLGKTVVEAIEKDAGITLDDVTDTAGGQGPS
ncbi:N-acetylneuraminate synthase family protein [Halosimplex rubrum]|uniref:N-acetylneuraminate synthase family protein n=1 Tax=Halosimplex rubrum TaxID=869889 RepID=A0A7D5SPL7_9EURY|nr:N-acetylneuraminate synthase family protein [Halosimplex rubrum]QLH76827.1 N-acetylneuraminate synthase family protein [Halosimplex rubrum]